MAAFLNRGMSMISGNGYDAMVDQTTSRHGAHNNVNSPLQIFVKAKKNINDIFGDISDYVVETTNFIEGTFLIEINGSIKIIYIVVVFNLGLAESQTDIVDKAETEMFRSFVFKINNIREVLARDNMKVAFFGRTSNEKSSVINAMLRDKILPSGIGHTTNCFCQVEGVDGQDAYLTREGSDEKLNVTVSIIFLKLTYWVFNYFISL